MNQVAPDLMEKVIGFRGWSIGEGNTLISVGYGTGAGPWKPGPQRAICLKHSGDLPIPCIPVVQSHCECGLYALHKYKDVTHYGSITGIVTGWGRMAIHPRGWRAQYAELMALVLASTHDEKIIRALAEKYGVPVIDAAHATEYAKEFGDYVPESMRTFDQEYEDLSNIVFYPISDWILNVGHAIMAGHNPDPHRLHPLAVLEATMDPDVPEAMAAIYDLYVPNLGEVIDALHGPIHIDYESFKPEEFKPAELGPDVTGCYHQSISSNGTVAYLKIENSPILTP